MGSGSQTASQPPGPAGWPACRRLTSVLNHAVSTPAAAGAAAAGTDCCCCCCCCCCCYRCETLRAYRRTAAVTCASGGRRALRGAPGRAAPSLSGREPPRAHRCVRPPPGGCLCDELNLRLRVAVEAREGQRRSRRQAEPASLSGCRGPGFRSPKS